MTPLLLTIAAGVISNLLADYITKKYQKTTPAIIYNITNINYYGDVQNVYLGRAEKYFFGGSGFFLLPFLFISFLVLL